MIGDLNAYINLLCKTKLTQRQFLYLFLISRERGDLLEKYKKTFPVNENNTKESMLSKYEIEDLEKGGYIEKKGNDFYIAPKFYKEFAKESVLIENLIHHYPKFAEIQGKVIPLTSVNPNILEKYYGQCILNSIDEHEEIIKDINYGIENNLLNMSIEKFILSKHWVNIRNLRFEKKSKVVSNLNIE